MSFGGCVLWVLFFLVGLPILVMLFVVAWPVALVFVGAMILGALAKAGENNV